ncbi:hypothetical protein ElyMa_003407700 [Elysia marginata]|uniref:Uncharacterized protein n=1 Tax=Elysia marginata TaxID=1093978 RepID=A0AAV4JP91_9GAST|nr:hypothetical protein ElyMa_003407700 [Elysia marginata]
MGRCVHMDTVFALVGGGVGEPSVDCTNQGLSLSSVQLHLLATSPPLALAKPVGPGRRASAANSVLNCDCKQRAPTHPPPLFLFVSPKTHLGSLYIFP